MNPLHPVVLAVQSRYAEAFDHFLVWFDHELGPELAEARATVRTAGEDEVDMIAGMEAGVVEARAAANVERPGRYQDQRASFFQGAGSSGFVPIREAVAWSRTTHGGRQLPLLAPPPEGGCFRWGMCEAPATDDNR